MEHQQRHRLDAEPAPSSEEIRLSLGQLPLDLLHVLLGRWKLPYAVSRLASHAAAVHDLQRTLALFMNPPMCPIGRSFWRPLSRSSTTSPRSTCSSASTSTKGSRLPASPSAASPSVSTPMGVLRWLLLLLHSVHAHPLTRLVCVAHRAHGIHERALVNVVGVAAALLHHLREGLLHHGIAHH